MDEYWASWKTMSETELHKLGIFEVKDSECAPNTPDRAQKTLPMTVALRDSFSKKSYIQDGILGVWSNTMLPRGTRFGPVVGRIITPHEVSPEMDKKIFLENLQQRSRNSFVHSGRKRCFSGKLDEICPAW